MGDGPFWIVGVSRSGTTLMRAMLHNHARLAVPGEAPWVTQLAPDATLDRIFAHRSWPWFGMGAEAVRERVVERRPESWPDLVDSIFSAYATAHGATRWGDKTPLQLQAMDRLLGWFPRARFIHMIRDGREVAASKKEQEFGPRTAVSAAIRWRASLLDGRRAGTRLGPSRYLEVRLEDLIESPERELRRVCVFLDEDYDPAMLYYHREIARRRLDVGGPWRHLYLPPTPGLRDWRRDLGRLERWGVEAVCRPTLVELGYESGSPRRSTAFADGLLKVAVSLRRVLGRAQ